MLSVRVIPCLDVKDGRVVKGVRFRNLSDAGDPVEAALRYSEQGADEICYLDITASAEGRGTLLGLVERTADVLSLPLTVGGGVRSVSHVRDLLLAGADKVAMNTACLERPELIAECAAFFGRQCIVVALDAKRVVSEDGGLCWHLFTYGGRCDTGLDALAFAERASVLGAGELLVTSMDRDGTGDGYDTLLLRLVRERVSVPVIASGGVGDLSHLVEGVVEGGADAVLAASIFHFGRHSVGEAKLALREGGVRVRPVESLESLGSV